MLWPFENGVGGMPHEFNENPKWPNLSRYLSTVFSETNLRCAGRYSNCDSYRIAFNSIINSRKAFVLKGFPALVTSTPGTLVECSVASIATFRRLSE
jgi:hypothetical protein